MMAASVYCTVGLITDDSSSYLISRSAEKKPGRTPSILEGSCFRMRLFPDAILIKCIYVAVWGGFEPTSPAARVISF